MVDWDFGVAARRVTASLLDRMVENSARHMDRVFECQDVALPVLALVFGEEEDSCAAWPDQEIECWEDTPIPAAVAIRRTILAVVAALRLVRSYDNSCD